MDPFGDLKRQMREMLIPRLGPEPGTRFTPGELEQKVRQTLQEVLADREMPLTSADRARIAQEVVDGIVSDDDAAGSQT